MVLKILIKLYVNFSASRSIIVVPFLITKKVYVRIKQKYNMIISYISTIKQRNNHLDRNISNGDAKQIKKLGVKVSLSKTKNF